MRRKKIKTVTMNGCRLEQLRMLAITLAERLDVIDDPRILAPLAKQYRETVREIEEIEGGERTDDEIGEILSDREADGKPGAVRKNRSGVPGK